MNTASVTQSSRNPHFLDPNQSTISGACECERDRDDSHCSCPQAASINNPPPGGEDDPKRYRWLFPVITMPFIIFAGVAYAVKWFKNRSGKGPGDDGAIGGNGPQNPSTEQTPEADPPAVSLRELLAVPFVPVGPLGIFNWFVLPRGGVPASRTGVPVVDGSRHGRLPYDPEIQGDVSREEDNARIRNITGRNSRPTRRGQIQTPDTEEATTVAGIFETGETTSALTPLQTGISTIMVGARTLFGERPPLYARPAALGARTYTAPRPVQIAPPPAATVPAL